MPARASFFALTPQKLQPPKLELPSTVQRGIRLTARVSVPGAAGLHALRLRVKTPDGIPFKPWEQTLLTDAAGIAADLPLAVNDPAGQWELSVTDCFSSEAKTTMTLNVE